MSLLRRFVIICSIAALTGADALAGPARSPSPTPSPTPTHANVSYGPHANQLMDIYRPPPGAGPSPVLLWFGSLWKPGKRPEGTRFRGTPSQRSDLRRRRYGCAAPP